ncbi:hypothetical protein AB5J55_22320 [Streptomyces sp. R11]|uniref:Uncharacterized protein n=1 Tax=Streptomyces sp. R11 TaxID=3238625 RepID=A0AB39N318_9ACTN
MPERFFYYEPADLFLCEEHMAESLGAMFPETGEECKGALWNYEGWDLETLVSALKESGELLPTQFKRKGVRMGPVEQNCMGLH